MYQREIPKAIALLGYKSLRQTEAAERGYLASDEILAPCIGPPGPAALTEFPFDANALRDNVTQSPSATKRH